MKLFLAVLSLAALSIFSDRAEAKISVLTYSSMVDKGGLGEWIRSQQKDVEFTTAKDFSGILGQLRRLKRQGKLGDIDVVLGLNETNYLTAKSEGLVEAGTAFEKSSYAILVNKNLLPEKQWPHSWRELAEKFKKKIIVQDPRTSEVGLAWLLNAVSLKNLSLKDAKDLPAKIFPKWSSSFDAFEKGAAPMIWTYASSVAYYDCNKIDKPYANLPLQAYPQDTNFVVATKGKGTIPRVKELLQFLTSKKSQEQIWQKNWMTPAKDVARPACYKDVLVADKDSRRVGGTKDGEIIKWLDEWSL